MNGNGMTADRMRDARLAAGLSQNDLAVRSGVPIGTIRDIEQGITRKPRQATVESIIDAICRYQGESPATSLPGVPVAGPSTGD